LIRIDVNAGQDVFKVLEQRLIDENVRDGVIASVIGAVDECCVSTMPKDDASRDIRREYCEPFEMFGTGEVRDGKPHIHCVLGREDGTALAGHLHRAKVSTWFVRVYVQRI
jgi:uncharacterized protein